VATRIGLDSFSPSLLTVARFLVAAVPAVLLGPPPVAWRALVALGLTLFAGQFLFQFFGIAQGMPPGLAAIVVQTQAFYTVLFAGLALHERPTRRQIAGMAFALAGLVAIAMTVGHDLTRLGLGLTTMSAVSWAIGNVLLKRLPAVDVLALTAWMSLIPPLPALALALALDGPAGIADAVVEASWPGIAAALYLGLIATVVAYAIWGALLRRYPTATVAPFALLVPFVAAAGSALVFGERFGAVRLTGMALVLLGLAVIVLPWPAGGRTARLDADRLLPIAPARRRDVPEIVDLIGRVYAEYGFVWDPAHEVPDLVDFDAHYVAPRGAFFVARRGGRIVGSVGVERLDAERAELHRLYVDADLRGHGTGRGLVEAVLRWCRQRSIRRLVLWSDTRFDRAHRLYARMGFERGGERELPGDVNRTREYGFERPV
jgi:O-acetylserine/cysteine efflux transporter